MPILISRKRGVQYLIFAGIIAIVLFTVQYYISTKENKQQPKGTISDETFVYYANALESNEIEPTPTNNSINASLIPDTIIIEPGLYIFNEKRYALNNEGLYRFIDPHGNNLQRIVFKNDRNTLLSSLSWIVTHGNFHDVTPIKDLSKLALSSKLYLTCGNFALWAQRILSEENIDSRIVTSLTLDEWNDYDNGHTMLEVFDTGLKKWVAYDLDNNSFFVHESEPLSFLELTNYVKTNEYEIITIAGDTKLDVSGFNDKETNYNYGFIAENYMASIKSWYKRVLQVPMIQKDGYYYHYNLDSKDRINGYSPAYKYIDEDQFMNTFYGN